MRSRFLAIAGLTFCILLIQGGIAALTGSATRDGLTEIGIEHAAPLTLDVTMSTLKGHTLIELRNGIAEDIAVSVPQAWQRGEVRDAPLEAVQRGEATLGFVRWSLPRGATVSFSGKNIIDRIILHNPSGILITLRLTRVDGDRNTASHETLLIQEETKEL